MNPPLIPIPGLSENPDALEYFWHQIPYGFPLLLSFLIGLTISVLSFLNVFRSKDKKGYIFSFAMTILGLTFYVFIQFSRIVIFSLERILVSNRIIYILPFLGGSFAPIFIYYVSEKKDKLLIAAAFLYSMSALVIAYSVVTNTIFTGEVIKTEIGRFPVVFPKVVYAGMITTICMIYASFSSWRIYRTRQRSMERFIFYGFFSFVLIAVNVFLLISGKNIFPFAVFMFIPLLSIAYGAFRSDFLDLSDLLFKKNLLFYILSVFISLSFLVFAVGVALFLVPGENFQYRNFHFLIPLFSAVVTICLSAYIAGNNPENRLSMFVAMTLFMNGLLNIIMIFRGLYLPILIEHRIGQILFTFIAFNASVQFRLLYIAYNKEVPKISWLIDATAVLTSLFALSPYLYKGYYEFSFGRSGASGPVLLLFSLVNMITLFKILYDWYSFREEKKGSLQAMVMIFAVLGSILSLSAVPSTLGLPIYPLTNLQFIPSLVLAFAILKFHALPIRGETVELTNKISFASTLLVPIILLFYFGGQRIDTSRFQLVLHIVFIGSFLIISIFTFTYILLRPIAKKLDEEKEKILQAQLETETERQKSEKLLLNILPKDVASELKEKGFAEPVLFENVSDVY